MKLAVFISYFITLVSARSKIDVCNSPACQNKARIYKEAMNPTVKPCDNFYKFACDNYLKKVKIPDDQDQWGDYEILNDQIQKQLIPELEAKTLDGQPPWFQNAKDYYNSCMNTGLIEKNSNMDMRKRLTTYGGWPVLVDNWKEINNSWEDIMRRLTKAGDNNGQILRVGVEFSQRDPTKRNIWVDARSFMFDLSVGNTVDTYLNVLIDIAVAYGASRTRAEQDMADVVDFETALSNMMYDGRNDVIVYQTIAETQEQWPYINWLELIHTYIGDDLGITEEEIIAVWRPTYITELADLLEQTSKRVVANYIMSQLIFYSAQYLSKEIINIITKLDQATDLQEAEKLPRNIFCLTDLINSDMQIALGALYIRKYFSPEKKLKAEEYISILQDQFSKIVADEDWLDDETKKRAVEKVKKIKRFIGYPDEFLNDTIITNYYKNLKFCPRNLYGNALALRRFTTYRINHKLRQPVDNTFWEDAVPYYVINPNVVYEESTNAIFIYSAILQDLYFDENLPTFMNYGSLSSTHASNIAYSLATKGIQYDENGIKVDWWSRASEAEFNKRVGALVKEYSTYVVKEVNLTLHAENMIDAILTIQAGIKIGRTALEGWLKTQEKDHRLVGLEQYTAPQIFWLAEANPECTKESVSWLIEDALSLNFPPGEYRVNGAFRQSAQFAKDWNCPVGSYMNPKHKFNVW